MSPVSSSTTCSEPEIQFHPITGAENSFTNSLINKHNTLFHHCPTTNLRYSPRNTSHTNSWFPINLSLFPSQFTPPDAAAAAPRKEYVSYFSNSPPITEDFFFRQKAKINRCGLMWWFEEPESGFYGIFLAVTADEIGNSESVPWKRSQDPFKPKEQSNANCWSSSTSSSSPPPASSAVA